jgi:hypothetical protein
MGVKALSDFGSLPFEAQRRIESELDRDEKMVWCSRQTTTRRLVLATVPVAVFGMFFGGFALFWIVMAFTMTAKSNSGDAPAFFHYVFPLFGIPFLLVGLAMVSTPLWAARRARKNFYVLTSKRAIVWQAGLFGAVNVRSFRADDLQDMTRVEYGDGSGDLVFQQRATTTYSRRHGQRQSVQQVGFLGIEDVRDVERQVRETLLPAK